MVVPPYHLEPLEPSQARNFPRGLWASLKHAATEEDAKAASGLQRHLPAATYLRCPTPNLIACTAFLNTRLHLKCMRTWPVSGLQPSS